MNLRAPTWILVADASRARLFSTNGVTQDLKELKAYSHPESRVKNRDLVTDKPGRLAQTYGRPFPGSGRGSRSGIEQEYSPKDVERELFARELGAELERGLAEGAYDKLILVANPEFLGTLRLVADMQVLKRVAASIDKDYTMLTPKELGRQLASVMPAA